MVALAQAVLADLGKGDVHVVGSGQVAGGPDERVVVQDVQDAGDGDEHVVLGELRLGGEVVAAPAAPAVAVTAPAATAAAFEVVVALALALALAAVVALTLTLTAVAVLALAAVAVALAALVPGVGLAAVAVTLAAVLAAAAVTLTAVALLAAVAAGLALALALAGLALGGLGLGLLLLLGRGGGLGRGLGLGGRLGRLLGGGAAGRRSAAGSPAGWPGMSICCWAGAALAFSALASAASPVRAREVARRLGFSAAGAALPASAWPAPPAWRSLMTSISWLLRIRAVPLMPRPEATCWSSARTMPSRPVPDRRRREALPEAAPVAGAAEASEAGAASVRTPIRSVVSLTKGPSLERASA
ncbi:membrane protein of unknown function [Streptantibioticus cattleyicolor NRRL 8057 = DSM 46488]|nr:membrane protein of unknown function [Streptantibioticus cattleyicolor NRRL 8057 = DSM 46488]